MSADVYSLCRSSDKIIAVIRLFRHGKMPHSLGTLPVLAATNLFSVTLGSILVGDICFVSWCNAGTSGCCIPLHGFTCNKVLLSSDVY